jgi:hypothetical protein
MSSDKHKEQGLLPTALPVWVNIRDIALAHGKAIGVEKAAAKLFFVTAGTYSNRQLVEIIWSDLLRLRDELPDANHWGGAPNPRLESFGHDTS